VSNTAPTTLGTAGWLFRGTARSLAIGALVIGNKGHWGGMAKEGESRVCELGMVMPVPFQEGGGFFLSYRS
jgi:hypothetical protein